MSDNPVQIRPLAETDVAFVFDTWLNAWRKSPWAGCIPNNLYYATTRTAIEQLVARGAEFNVACRAADSNHILGWVCYEVPKPRTEHDPVKTIVHFLYVKEAYLPFAVGEKLVGSCPGQKPGFYTHRYRQVVDACPSQEGWRHIPEAARRK